MRFRIRTVKPEMWQDEKVGDLSHGARLLFVGLISMADDEGRLRELPTAIIGHVFPYDNVTATRVMRWLREIEQSGMIVRYTDDGKRYVAFAHWSRHQRVDRPCPSDLPAPPDDSTKARRGLDDDSTINRRRLDEGSIPTRGGAVRGPDPDPDPDPSLSQGEEKTRGEGENDALPDGFPGELRAHFDAAFTVLSDLAVRHGAKAVCRRSLAATMMAPQRRHKPFVRCAYDYAAWADSKAQRRRDVRAGYRNWLDGTDDLAGVEPIEPHAGPAARGLRSAALEQQDDWRVEYRRGAA